MLSNVKSVLAVAVVVFVPAGVLTLSQRSSAQVRPAAATVSFDAAIDQNAARMLKEGRQIFRYDTFGSEDFWGGKLRLHEAIVGQKLGGVGPGVSPKTALSLGLKVDSDALPADLVAAIKAGKVDMDDPASTVALLKANAVVSELQVTTWFRPRTTALRDLLVASAHCAERRGRDSNPR